MEEQNYTFYMNVNGRVVGTVVILLVYDQKGDLVLPWREIELYLIYRQIVFGHFFSMFNKVY